MRYYKLIESGYITLIGTGSADGVDITEQEYKQIMAIIHQKPPRTDTTDFRLKDDLTWEEYESPQSHPEPPEDVGETEILSILLGDES